MSAHRRAGQITAQSASLADDEAVERLLTALQVALERILRLSPAQAAAVSVATRAAIHTTYALTTPDQPKAANPMPLRWSSAPVRDRRPHAQL